VGADEIRRRLSRLAGKQGTPQDPAPNTAGPPGPDPSGRGTPGGEQMVMGRMKEALAGAWPDCGSQLEFAEGCMKCHVCGFSECG